ncbi:hypothetical protein ALON55S_03310 [Alishewanella longhuensis]
MNTAIPVGAKRSLLPLLFFVLLFLGSGLYFQSQNVDYAFYQLPGHVAILPALMLAVWLHRAPLTQSIEVIFTSVITIITMCLIYLLAGAFASVATAQSGGVDAVVNAGLSIIPSISIGYSVGRLTRQYFCYYAIQNLGQEYRNRLCQCTRDLFISHASKCLKRIY